MSKSELNEKQTSFLMGLAMGVSQLITQLDYDCDKMADRKEVLDVLETFYSSMYRGHLQLIEEDKNGIAKDSDKEL